jgi:hypothetical protein
VKVVHRVADRFEHPPDLVVASFVEDELDAAGREAADARRCGAAVLELDPVA